MIAASASSPKHAGCCANCSESMARSPSTSHFVATPGGREASTSRSVLLELPGELIEAHAAEVQRVAVEVLEVERCALAALCALAAVEPDPLPHLVRDRLSRPSEIAVDLRCHEVGRKARTLDHE